MPSRPLSRRECPWCGLRIGIEYETAEKGPSTVADALPVAVFVEHDPCPGSYRPVNASPAKPPPPRSRPPLIRAAPTRDRVAAFLAANPGSTTRQIAAFVEKPTATLRGVLSRMRAAHQVIREVPPAGRPVVWLPGPAR